MFWSLLIQNEWVYIKWQYLSEVTRGRYGKKYDSWFTLFRMLLFLRLALEAMYCVVRSAQIVNAKVVPVVVSDGG